MKKFPKLLLAIATNSLILTTIFLIGSFISKEDSSEESIFSGIAFYGTLITFYILALHFLFVLISFIIKMINKLDREN